MRLSYGVVQHVQVKFHLAFIFGWNSPIFNSITIAIIACKRLLAEAIRQGQIVVEGKSRASRYSITPQTHLLMSFDTDTYFQKEIDKREVQASFNFDLIERLLSGVSFFSKEEQ